MFGPYIESCLRLDVYDVLDGTAALSHRQTGLLQWQEPNGVIFSAVGFHLRWPSPVNGELLLTYADQPKTRTPVRLCIGLTRTQPGFGGNRWWFHCPIAEQNVCCERRVKALFLPALERRAI